MPNAEKTLKTLTILARDRRGQPDPGTQGDVDPAIADVKERLYSRTDKSNHNVAEARNVEELRALLAEPANKAPDRLQIIGHGSAGMLSLGTRVRNYSDGPHGPHYMLDSNPFVHGLLAGLVRRPTKVWLLGCAVGDEGIEGMGMTIARGPTLLFDLAQMWDCEVGGPASVISAKDFDERGIFSDPARLTTVDGFTLKKASLSPVMPWRKYSLTTPPTMTRMLRAPILGPRESLVKNNPVKPSQSRDLWKVYEEEVDLPPLLALPEIVFDATLEDEPDEPATCELLANGRVLRLSDNGQVRHFAAREDQRHTVFELTRTMFAPVFGVH